MGNSEPLVPPFPSLDLLVAAAERKTEILTAQSTVSASETSSLRAHAERGGARSGFGRVSIHTSLCRGLGRRLKLRHGCRTI